MEIVGTRYSKGSVLFCSMDDDDTPVFGRILDIIVVSLHDDCLFVMCPYIGSSFSAHYNAYQVHTPDVSQYLFYKQKKLTDHHILSLSKSFDPSLSHILYVCLKYNVV